MIPNIHDKWKVQYSTLGAAGDAHMEVEYIHTFIAESSLGGG